VKVLVFGSSIAEGYWATRGRWVQQLIRVAHVVEVAGQAADVAVARVTAGRPSK
jgi:lysophospholipase L1-like esterase